MFRNISRGLVLLVLLWPIVARGAGEALDPTTGKLDEKTGIIFHDIHALGIEGQGWTDVKAPFDRLPARADGVVPTPVWNLSHHSAGLAVRFVTDAQTIAVRWSVGNKDLAMPHMPATGVSGVDLYVRLPSGAWHWLAVGKPAGLDSLLTLKSIPAGEREFLLYLPLYNSTTSAEVGVPTGKSLKKAPPRPAEKTKPIVFYGTSITHGACASRPGMCHPAILGRRLDWPVINLGFSGNGRMEKQLAEIICDLDPAVLVLDCLPNMSAEQVKERAAKFVDVVRSKHPQTPILLVEDRTFADSFMYPEKMQGQRDRRAELKNVYDALIAAGDKNVSYLQGEKLLGEDGEDTVDSSHPSDLGFYRQADAFEKPLREMLKLK